MLFNSLEFGVFMALVVTAVFLLKFKEYQLTFLLVASYFFYFLDMRWYLLLLAGSSLFNYWIGMLLYENKRFREYILSFGILVNVAILGYFKYANFFIENVNQVLSHFGMSGLGSLSVLLPIGISFFTFQQISYIIDVYWKKIPASDSLRDYFLLVSFFPHLIAGPIVRASDLLPQFKNGVHLACDNIKQGISYIGWGLVKKVVFADNIAPLVSAVFNDPLQYYSLPIIIGALAFAIQIYCDFSAYTDIAIGTARIFGFQFPHNFDKPYFAKNPSDMWRRWHMSLNQWMNDYVFKPLFVLLSAKKVFTFLKNPKWITQANIFVTIFITALIFGFWHGASWNFLLFGMVQASILIIYHLVKKYWDNAHRYLQTLGTLYLTVFCFIIFRQTNIDLALQMMKKFIIIDIGPLFPTLAFLWNFRFPIFFMFVFVVLHSFSRYKENTLAWINSFNLCHWYLFLSLVVFLLFLFTPTFNTEFIYFQF